MNQIDDLMEEIQQRVEADERVLVTTLTKRMAEELNEHLQRWDVKSAYIHSDVDTLDRIRILEDLREGTYDVLIGVNLLREGLDLPQVSLVAILDADKEGFLRNHRSLTQTAGRAARNVNGKVIMYADRITDSMQLTIDETERRRNKQMAYNEAHGIVPTPINKKSRTDLLDIYADGDNHGSTAAQSPTVSKPRLKNPSLSAKAATQNRQPRPYVEQEAAERFVADPVTAYMSVAEIKTRIEKVNRDMVAAAKRTDFIEAAQLRDELIALRSLLDGKLQKEDA